jgi:predicted nucleic acid-binding protein
MRLADTSVWIDHFHRSDLQLTQTIENGQLVCHPAVIGELAMGSLRNRTAVIGFLQAQRMVHVATHDEVMAMVEVHKLHGMGIGYTDAHLLASTLIDSRAALWTRDKRLQSVGKKAGARLFIG